MSRKREIVRALERDIVMGTLRPGTRIDERGLAERFGVSRTPVRDAIAELVAAGLVEVKPRSGTHVARVRLSELLAIFEAMCEFEATCARLATRRMDADALDALDRAAEACLATAGRGDVDAYTDLNFAFHDVIYRGTGNPILEATTRQTRQRVSSYRRASQCLPGRLEASAADHLAISRAMRARDAEQAATLMREHVDILGKDYHEFVRLIRAITDPDEPETPTPDPAVPPIRLVR